MEFTINSKQKKVELFYESAAELNAVLEIINNWASFKNESKDNASIYINGPDISWSTVSSAAPSFNGKNLYTSNTILDTATFGTICTAESDGAKTYTDVGKIEAVDEPLNCIMVEVPRPSK